MSSTASMDISENFRPEDLSKTDFFDFVTAPDMGIGVERPPTNDVNGNIDPPLQGYDQFWGAEKDSDRLDTAIFEDLNRYCWNQQTTNVSSNLNSGQTVNTDGQIYTLTVLNGSETWLKKENPETTTSQSLDIDSLLGTFPGYIKSEFTYDDSGFSTEHKDDLLGGNQAITTNVLVNSSNLPDFQGLSNNNNNDWHISNHNPTDQNSAESLLRSALQGKGYTKNVHIQNGIPMTHTHIREIKVEDDDLRRSFFTDQENLAYADSTLANSIFEEHHTPTDNSPNSVGVGNVAVEDMFLTLETFEDFEKIKKMTAEVQQYCVSDSYPEVIIESIPPSLVQSESLSVVSQPSILSTSSSLCTPATTTLTTPPKTTKKYKRVNSSTSNSSSNNISSNNNNNISNNNNNSSTLNNNSMQCSPGQRKERSLHYCSICSKGFKDKYSVNVHIRTHTGEKPFACSLCGKSFRQKAHLAKHYQTHLAQKNPSNVVKGGKAHQNNNTNNNNNNSVNPSTTTTSGAIITR